MKYARCFGLALLLGLPLFFSSLGPTSTNLQGQVLDAHGPVPGARVRLQGDAAAFHTGADGRFQLSAPRRPGARLTAWKRGYRIASAAAVQDPLCLFLTPL